MAERKLFLSTLMFAFAVTLGAAACEDRRDTGDKIEDAAEEVGDEIEDATD